MAINIYILYINFISIPNTYPLDADLSVRYYYRTFEQLGPALQ